MVMITGLFLLVIAGIWDANPKAMGRKTSKETIYIVPALVAVIGLAMVLDPTVANAIERSGLGPTKTDLESPGGAIYLFLLIGLTVALVKLGHFICKLTLAYRSMSKITK